MGADVGVGDDLDHAVAGLGEDAAGFVVEGEDGFFDLLGEVEKRGGDGVGDGELAAGFGVDKVFEHLEGFVAGHEAADGLGEDDLVPVLGDDVIHGVGQPGGAAGLVGGDEDGNGHGVVSAGEDDLFFLRERFVEVAGEAAAVGGGEGDDGDVDLGEQVVFFVESGLVFQVFGRGLVGGWFGHRLSIEYRVSSIKGY